MQPHCTCMGHTGAQHIFAGGSAAASGAWLLQRRCQARRFVLQHGWGSAVPAALPRAGSERHISVASSGEQLRSAPGDVGCRRATGHTDSSPCPPLQDCCCTLGCCATWETQPGAPTRRSACCGMPLEGRTRPMPAPNPGKTQTLIVILHSPAVRRWPAGVGAAVCVGLW